MLRSGMPVETGMPRVKVASEERVLRSLGRSMPQQELAAERLKADGRDAEARRFDQGRWAFREAGHDLCREFGLDWDAWLDEWRIQHE